jgi:hypothetical protein
MQRVTRATDWTGGHLGEHELADVSNAGSRGCWVEHRLSFRSYDYDRHFGHCCGHAGSVLIKKLVMDAFWSDVAFPPLPGTGYKTKLSAQPKLG